MPLVAMQPLGSVLHDYSVLEEHCLLVKYILNYHHLQRNHQAQAQRTVIYLEVLNCDVTDDVILVGASLHTKNLPYQVLLRSNMRKWSYLANKLKF